MGSQNDKEIVCLGFSQNGSQPKTIGNRWHQVIFRSADEIDFLCVGLLWIEPAKLHRCAFSYQSFQGVGRGETALLEFISMILQKGP
uniref:Uncharacterized protein n=1 Tax=Candidatus Kentrum sp. LFY TaxID=2126342 RepID=A0A450WJI3_9GAMM|nr:MAG: hypothetical protein BECKLFY1418C_GA0070996_102926 [Candidatus Kentron sp. LFY]